MLTAIPSSQEPQRGTLFARIPLPIDFPAAELQFETPLRHWLAAQRIPCTVRCFALPGEAPEAGGIGIEIQTNSVLSLAALPQKLAELGAPPRTRIELETDKGTVEMILHEANSP